MLKRAMVWVAVWQLAGAGLLAAAQIGVVNMERLIQLHPRTAQDRAVLERYVKDFEVEREDRVAALRKLSEEFEALRQQSEDIGLTAEAAQERRQRAQLKLEELREAETSLREVATQRQRDLTQQEMRLRLGVIREIRRVLREMAEARGLDLILDGGEDPAGGYGAVVFAKPEYDLTDEVVLKLREDTGAGTAATEAQAAP